MTSEAPDAKLDDREPVSLIPRLACDLPIDRPGAIVHNELILGGWAVSPVGISGIVVQIDDRLLHAAYGLETPWAAESMPEIAGAGFAGYRLALDTSDWAPGPRKITITAYDQQGGRGDIVGEVDIVPFQPPAYSKDDQLAALAESRIAFGLEWPSLGESVPEIESPIEISGWAYAAGGLETVLVTIDGETRYEALRPIARPDLLDDYGEEVAAHAGFALQLHARDCPPGWHRLRVVAIDGERRAVGVETNLNCLPEPPPTEAPAPGEAMAVDWRPTPRPTPSGPRGRRDNDLEQAAGSLQETKRQLRQRLAALLAADRDALHVARDDLAAELPHDDGSFDVVTCLEGIADAADLGATLDELRRVLRADGILLMTGPRRIERALRERFANVRLHQQRSLLASVVIDDDSAAGDGVAGMEVSKLGEWRPGGEDVVIAVAGAGELPELERMAMLAPPGALRSLGEALRTWEDRVLLAEADAAASRNEANLAKMHQEATVRELRDGQRDAEALRQSLAEARALQEARTVEFEERRSGLEAQAAGLTERTSELEEQAARLAESNVELEEQAARLAPAEQRAAGAEATLAAQESSLSWRITRPLRALKRQALLARNLIGRR